MNNYKPKKIAPLNFAKQMRAQPTDAEKKLWYELRAKRFADFKFRRQQIIGPYIVDFVCQARKLIIEADGSHHDIDIDATRNNFLRAKGYRVMRFSNYEIMRNFSMIADNIWAGLHDMTFDPSPAATRPPLPQGEREKVA